MFEELWPHVAQAKRKFDIWDTSCVHIMWSHEDARPDERKLPQAYRDAKQYAQPALRRPSQPQKIFLDLFKPDCFKKSVQWTCKRSMYAISVVIASFFDSNHFWHFPTMWSQVQMAAELWIQQHGFCKRFLDAHGCWDMNPATFLGRDMKPRWVLQRAMLVDATADTWIPQNVYCRSSHYVWNIGHSLIFFSRSHKNVFFFIFAFTIFTKIPFFIFVVCHGLSHIRVSHCHLRCGMTKINSKKLSLVWTIYFYYNTSIQIFILSADDTSKASALAIFFFTIIYQYIGPKKIIYFVKTFCLQKSVIININFWRLICVRYLMFEWLDNQKMNKKQYL